MNFFFELSSNIAVACSYSSSVTKQILPFDAVYSIYGRNVFQFSALFCGPIQPVTKAKGDYIPLVKWPKRTQNTHLHLWY
jgi:hypothetical protein